MAELFLYTDEGWVQIGKDGRDGEDAIMPSIDELVSKALLQIPEPDKPEEVDYDKILSDLQKQIPGIHNLISEADVQRLISEVFDKHTHEVSEVRGFDQRVLEVTENHTHGIEDIDELEEFIDDKISKVAKSVRASKGGGGSGAGGAAVGGQNVGAGSFVFKEKSDDDLVFRSLRAATGMSVLDTGDQIDIGIEDSVSGVWYNASEFQTTGSASMPTGVSVMDFRLIGPDSVGPETGQSGVSLTMRSPNISTQASGTHDHLGNTVFVAPNITENGATIGNTATVYIKDASDATVTGDNYALWVDDGKVRIDGELEVASFEYISKNIRSSGSSITRDADDRIATMTSSDGITKTFNRDAEGKISSITLSGSIPSGLTVTTKTFSRSSGLLSGFSYS